MELLRRILLISCLFVFTSLLGGCSHLSYILQAGLGQLSLYNHERPLKEVIEDPRTAEEVRERLKWIPEIKNTVEAELGVKATSNYTTYVDLKRPYVVWSLTVAEPFALKLHEWSFPFVGSFPYLGFFKEETAREWQKDYESKGYDTYVRGVTAYSTLGYLRDPLLSSMLSRRKADMVNLIFHETTHGQVYIKGKGSFNEEAASYIGDYGERAWIVKTYGTASNELRDWENDRTDRRLLGRLLREFADDLKKAYTGGIGASDKQKLFTEHWSKLNSASWKGKRFSNASKVITNNAALLAFLTYEDDQYIFDLLEKKCGGRLADALRYLKSFADEWDRLKKPGATPQSVLYDRLLRQTGGAVCFDANVK